MQKITVYRFIRPDGGVSISPVKPDTEYTELYRLIADEGYTITDGTIVCECVDTDNPETWMEVEIERSETEQKALAYDILMGVRE